MIKTSLNILLIFISIFLFQSCTISEWLNFLLNPTWECQSTNQTFDNKETCEQHCDEQCVGYINK